MIYKRKIKSKIKDKIKVIKDFQVMSKSGDIGVRKPMIMQGGNARISELKSMLSLLK